ncbi:aldehyde dehydrogenase family protein [Methylocystis sp.]|uniref:aldehyde dehydrogenase family protein n=1 Tax=Methylocystis sp. TaxID=1911079 RepID=UPI003DA4E7BE
MQSINPATGQELLSYQEMTQAAVEDANTKAHETFLEWRWIPFPERATLMRRAVGVLRAGSRDYARAPRGISKR